MSGEKPTSDRPNRWHRRHQFWNAMKRHAYWTNRFNPYYNYGYAAAASPTYNYGGGYGMVKSGYIYYKKPFGHKRLPWNSVLTLLLKKNGRSVARYKVMISSLPYRFSMRIPAMRKYNHGNRRRPHGYQIMAIITNNQVDLHLKSRNVTNVKRRGTMKLIVE
ncbi:unnamed protein product [Didymodactylos carnosus]|uniref:Uncharacterized protein n=1 Tax=Didymodactylos carnosus TaxID=1234261 RepID=A0A813P312_9BILA|nr:unnamed protein product [Didymodactylos carnosus]CAF0949426.1 unnamed protein product [Didymodactylos carnosus]CAF3523267.1 unnamed protein product [Didymodactylos carnosus]CAF3723778.1 unnamed protein product [Didymodactylos carnosus]